MELTNKSWKCVQILNDERKLVSGASHLLIEAIVRAADLRIYTEFRHNEHIDTTSQNNEIVKEVADFRVTYLIDAKWIAGIINLRMPIELPGGFGPRPSMSFFLYNQDGTQSIARPYLDAKSLKGEKGLYPPDDFNQMPKYHQYDSWDSMTNFPSSNFVYDFDIYKYFVNDDWEEVFGNDKIGNVTFGTLDVLIDAFSRGKEIKVGIKELCYDLNNEGDKPISHEVFIHCGSCYYYSESKLFCAGSHPLVRVRPSIPMKYKSENWDFGWLMLRSDGNVSMWLADPYTLKFNRKKGNFDIRWFVR